MMLWLIFAGLSVAALAIMLSPLLRAARDSLPARADYDMTIYRHQLAEIAQDVERGLLPPDQAEAARAEIHRRMLAAEDAELAAASGDGPKDTRKTHLIAAVAIMLTLSLGSALLYAKLGSPDLAGAAHRGTGPDAAAAADAAKLASEVERSPSVTGYKQLGDKYFSARQYELSAGAYERAVNLGANDATTWSDYGEAIVMASDGAVVLPALRAFTRSLDVDPHDPRSRFYVGLAEGQIGDFRKAIAIWRDLEKDAQPDSPWLGMLREHVTAFAQQGGFDPATIAPQPPAIDSLNASLAAMSQAQGAPSADLSGATAPPSSDSGDTSMIKSMVARLAARLEANPDDPEGWQRLARSYTVLGDFPKAREAIDHAVRLRPSDPAVRLALADVQKAAAGTSQELPPDYVATMREVLKLDPENSKALYAVGAAEAAAGHSNSARELWEKALVRLPAGDPMVGDLQARLTALPPT